ncbi:UNVERIFIED_CONTAM: hypothetical protein FKN15_029938 [Acipenser sinensis]
MSSHAGVQTNKLNGQQSLLLMFVCFKNRTVKSLPSLAAFVAEGSREAWAENTTVVAYINHNGGLRLPSLHRVAHKLFLWAHKNLLSLQAVHLPGVKKLGSGPSLKEVLSTSEWRRTPHLGEQRYISCLPGINPLFPLTLHNRRRGQVGSRCLDTPVAEETVVCLPTIHLASAVSGENQSGPGQGAAQAP